MNNSTHRAAQETLFSRDYLDKNNRHFTIKQFEKYYTEAVLQMYDQFEPKESAQGLPPKDPVRRKQLILDILKESISIIAFHDNTVFGHSALMDIEKGVFAELLIVIHQDWQGVGLGKEMISFLLDIARIKSYRKIWLTVETANIKAIHVYKKFGFNFIDNLTSEREMELMITPNQNNLSTRRTERRRTGIVRDNIFLKHKTGIHHPEAPRRLETIYSMLDNDNLMEKLVQIPKRMASLEEVELVHAPEYIDRVMDTAGEELRYLDPDTVTSEQTCEAAFTAAGSCMEAVDQVVNSKIDNAFAFVRPPGHHAEKDRQMGFCIFNNTALAAAYALRYLGLSRVLIIDWDVHHCNGTQHTFESTDEVLVFSTHRFPFFPGTGSLDEIGKNNGLGYTVNVPLSPAKKDKDFIEIFKEILVPIAIEYNPQLIIISAGFDTHYDDPIGGMRVTENGFAYLTSIIMEMADQVCKGKIVAILEGGYDLGALRKSVKKIIETMMCSSSHQIFTKIDKMHSDPSTLQTIKEVKDIHKEYWRTFNNA